MATYGQISVFDAAVESWSQYVEKLEHFVLANDVTVEKKKAILLTLVWGQ